jgi:hypothetical protein
MEESELINESLSLLKGYFNGEEGPELDNSAARMSPDKVLIQYLAKHGINAWVDIEYMKKNIKDYNLIFDLIKTIRDYEAKRAAERGEILMYDHEHDTFYNQKTGETFTVEDIAIGEKVKV